MLLLYLALDDADDRPLIIDQPEENLDPKSVFEELVQLFVAAKKFDWNFIEQLAMPHKAVKTIITEALAGEEKLRDIPVGDLKKLLAEGLPSLEDLSGGAAHARSQRQNGRPVGKRDPERDPVGGAYA